VDVIALGSDNNPLIVLFKTAQNESVAARAVFYLDWLVNNKNLFNKLVQKTFPGMNVDGIDWQSRCLLCGK